MKILHSSLLEWLIFTSVISKCVLLPFIFIVVMQCKFMNKKINVTCERFPSKTGKAYFNWSCITTQHTAIRFQTKNAGFKVQNTKCSRKRSDVLHHTHFINLANFLLLITSETYVSREIPDKPWILHSCSTFRIIWIILTSITNGTWGYLSLIIVRPYPLGLYPYLETCTVRRTVCYWQM